MSRTTRYVLWLNQCSCSVYFGLLAVLEETWKPSSALLHRLGYPLYQYVYPVLARLFHRAEFSPGPAIHSLALWGLLAVTFFVCLHLLDQVAFTRALLRIFTGTLSFAAFPLLWLRLGNLPGMSLVAPRWLLLEVAVIVACAFLYVYGRWPTNPALSILVLLLHFGFWGQVTWGKLSTGFWCLYLLIGSCTSFIWGVYVRESRQAAGSAAAAS
jgi:hypothetical protein